jgi:prophage maintenance system killer protein
MIRLTKKQILMLHSQLILETGGSDGVRDENRTQFLKWQLVI